MEWPLNQCCHEPFDLPGAVRLLCSLGHDWVEPAATKCLINTEPCAETHGFPKDEENCAYDSSFHEQDMKLNSL